jgi:flagellar biosynthesis protein FliR
MDWIPTAQRILANAGVHTDLSSFLLLFGLVFTRLTIALSLSPFFGGGVPGQIKVGLSVIIAAVLYPSVAPAGGLPMQMNGLIFFGLLAKEALIGAIIGLLIQMVFYSVQMAGTLIDTARGMNQITYVAPQLQGHTSAFGQLQFQACLVLFLTIDGHLFFLKGLQTSFQQLPLLAYPSFQPGLTPLLEKMMRVGSDVMLIALRLSAPVLVAMFLIDVSFGAIGKVASQINVYQESQPVKALAGLGVLLLGIGIMFEQILIHLSGSVSGIMEIVRVLR